MTTTTRTSAAPLFFFNDTATTEIYTLSLHDAPPIWSESDKEIKRETLRGAIGGEACQHAPEPLTVFPDDGEHRAGLDRKSTRLNSSHSQISYAVFCLKQKKKKKVLARSVIRQCRLSC